MESLINGKKVPLELVTCRGMGFGKPTLKLEVARYDLIIPINEFTNVVEKVFNDYVNETKSEDEKFDEIYSKELYELGYPSYAELINSDNKVLIAEYIKELHFPEFLVECSEEFSIIGRKKDYLINSVDSIIIYDETVVIKGEAYILKLSK